MSPLYPALGTAVAVSVLLGGIVAGRPRLAGVAKMVASTGFLVTALVAGGGGTAHGTIILFGLLCSWWGDLFLISRARRVFLCGIVAFLLGHLAYAAAFLQLGVEWPWVAAALVPLGGAVLLVLWWLGDGPGRLRAAVHAYVAVITAMLALALGAAAAGGPILLLPAALLFYVSDLFVARERFVVSGRFNRLAGLPLYYAGQVLFAWAAGQAA